MDQNNQVMFYKKKRSVREEEIGGLTCNIPPKPRDISQIRGSHLPKKDQKWYREGLPKIPAKDVEFFTDEGATVRPSDLLDWHVVRRQEIIKQTGKDPWNVDRDGNPKPVSGVIPNPNYINHVLDQFRKREFMRCYPWPTDSNGQEVNNGLWFMNNGEPTYITPFHYFYLEWWPLNTGYAFYRDTDRQKFYFWQYCFEDPNCYGFLEVDKRGGGKSYRAASVAYQRTIYGKNTHTGIQSKTEEDAREFFQKKLVEPYKRLPDFLIPINRSGTSPSKNIEFMVKSTRAKNAMELLHEQQLALNSVLDYKSAKETSYDGANITGIMLRDEEGKVDKKEADVAARHDVTKACVYRDGVIMGKIYSTTTVEEMEKGGEQYEQIFMDSNPLEKNDLGETKSGLYRLFMPAYMTEKFDTYGMPVVDDPPHNKIVYNQKTGERIYRGAKTEQAIRRKQFENDPKKLLRYCLKYPWHEEELFYNSAQDCPFNVMILEQAELHYKMHRSGRLDQMEQLGFLEKPVFGNFVWKDNIPFTEAIFVEDTELNSMWSVCYLFPNGDRKANNVKIDRYNSGKQFFSPRNNKEFFGGFDPTKAGKTVDKRRSKAGGTIFRKKQFWEKPEMGYHGTWVADFLWEPDDPLMQYDYFLIGLWYYGAQVLLENNIPTMLDRYGQYGAFDQHSPDEHFIIWRWEQTFTSGSQQYTPGLPSNDPMNNMLLQNTQYHIVKDGGRLRLPRLIKDLKKYRESTRGQHDLSVSAQLSYMASTKPEPPEPQRVELGGLFRRF